MVTKNLFDKVLIDPVKNGANKLYIVSGYATAAMTFHHLETIKRTLGRQIQIKMDDYP